MAHHGLEVWLGPACSGKTTRLLELYRAELQANTRKMDLGKTLWLVPSFRSKQQLLRRLPGDETVCFAPGVHTFEEFAEQILPSSSEPIAPLGTATRHLLLRQIIDELTASGTISEYASIAGTRGFTDLISRTISELKRNEIWPEDLERFVADQPGRVSDRELAAIYAGYQQKLLEHHWYDAEGRFWSAARLLDQGNWGLFPKFSLVVVDGFTDFIETQYHLLGHLLKRSEKMCLSLPAEEEDRPELFSRPDLFARSERVLERLREIGPLEIKRIKPQSDSAETPPAIRRIADHLFDNPRTIQKTKESAGLEIWGLTGPRGEVRHAALRIQELLRRGIAADQIAVGIRDLQGYGDLIEELFTEAGIPFYCEASSPLRRAPIIVALLQLLRIINDDWSYTALLSGLRNDYLRIVWESGEDFVPNLGRFLRNEELTSGREAILSRLANRFEVALEEERPQFEALLHDLMRLSDLLSTCEKTGTWEQWTGRILHLAHEFGLSQDQEKEPFELHAWHAFVETIEGVAETLPLLSQQDSRLTLEEFLAKLEDLLNVVTLNERAPRIGDVPVLDAGEVRHLDVPYLFLLGLTERSFPARSSENCIYNERDRTELNAQGIRLQLKEQRQQDEMLLFYGIATRARKHLVLSYPHVDASGEELNCSPYVENLRELFEPGSIEQITEEHLDPVPTRMQMLGLRDQRIIATAEVLNRKPALFAGLLEARDQGDLCRNLAAAVEMNLRRYHDRGFTIYEGMLHNATNRSYLADHYGTGREFTVSQLETYAACPFRAFVADTLKIAPHAIPGLETDHLFRGTLLHDLLSRLHDELNQELDSGGLDPEQMVDWISRRFEEMLHEEFESHVTLGGVIGTLREIERDFLLEWAGPYAEQVQKYEEKTSKLLGTPLRPVKFELSFGYDRQTKMQNAPLILGRGDALVKLAGRIDRIDQCSVGETTLYGLIDYKSGSLPKCNDKTVASGRELQLAVYALAIEQLELLERDSILAQVGYWSLREEGFVSASRGPDLAKRSPDEGWLQLMETARQIVPRLVLSLRQGEFPPYNTEHECTSYCPYKTVCRVNQIRPLEETLEKVWKLPIPEPPAPTEKPAASDIKTESPPKKPRGRKGGSA